MEESELNITSIFKADKDNLFKSLKNKEIKEESSISKSKTKWSDLRDIYRGHINQCAEKTLNMIKNVNSTGLNSNTHKNKNDGVGD